MIRRKTGARVTLIHHSGKDRKRGARGGSALTAAADTVISIDEQGGRHIVRCDKQRDGERFAPFYLRLTPDPVGQTAYFVKCDGPTVSMVPASGDALQADILSRLRSHPYTSGSTLAAQLHKQKSAVLEALNSLHATGRVQFRAEGRAKFWTVPDGSAAEGPS
jgi:hypothetical protein